MTGPAATVPDVGSPLFVLAALAAVPLVFGVASCGAAWLLRGWWRFGSIVLGCLGAGAIAAALLLSPPPTSFYLTTTIAAVGLMGLGLLWGVRHTVRETRAVPTPEGPIVEHPGGDFDTAVDAITQAIARIRDPAFAGRTISLSAQGSSGGSEASSFASIQWRDGTFTFAEPVAELDALCRAAGMAPTEFTVDRRNCTLTAPTVDAPRLAGLIDRIFRTRFDIRPFAGETDYAFGAELR